MMTEMQDSATITYWINSLIQAGFKIPRAAVTDRSSALENSLSMAFNWIPFAQFNEECLLILLGLKRMSSSLRCWIRNDIAHLIKSVCRWECFTNKDIKSFYCRIIGFMSKIESFELFKKVAKAVFIVASTEFFTEEVRTSRKFLVELIRTHKFELPTELHDLVESEVAEEPLLGEEEVFELDPEDDEDADGEVEATSNQTKRPKKKDLLGEFINDLKLDCQPQRSPSSFDRFQYPRNESASSAFVASFSLLLRSFASWSNVMRSHFDAVEEVPTSARCEANFNEIKSSLREICLRPMRVDKFLTWHCCMIADIMKEAFAVFELLKDTAPRLPRRKLIRKDFEYLQAYENWKNRGRPPNPNYQDLDTEVNSPDDSLAASESTLFSGQFTSSVRGATNCTVPDSNLINESIIISSDVFNQNFLMDSMDISMNELIPLPVLSSSGIDTLSHQVNIRSLQSSQPPPPLPPPPATVIITNPGSPAIASTSTAVKRKRPQRVHLIDDRPRKKRRGMYVSAYPGFISEEKQPVAPRRHQFILANAHLIDPISINGKFVSFSNSCSFDSLTELFMHAYHTCKSFYDFVNQNKQDGGDYLSFITAYFNSSKNLRDIYILRAEILYNFNDNINATNVNCEFELLDLFKNIMLRYVIEPEIVVCGSCGTPYEQSFGVVEPPNIEVFSDGFTKLENAVNNALVSNSNECDLCNLCYNLNRKVGDFICVNVEQYFRPDVAPGRKQYECSVKDIPVEILVQNKKFVLVGAIEYASHHYITYCRNLKNIWDKRNDTNGPYYVIDSLKQKELKQKRKFSLFLYCRS